MSWLFILFLFLCWDLLPGVRSLVEFLVQSLVLPLLTGCLESCLLLPQLVRLWTRQMVHSVQYWGQSVLICEWDVRIGPSYLGVGITPVSRSKTSVGLENSYYSSSDTRVWGLTRFCRFPCVTGAGVTAGVGRALWGRAQNTISSSGGDVWGGGQSVAHYLWYGHRILCGLWLSW